MFKFLRSLTSGIKVVRKYGSLFIVILDILGYSGDKLESWQKDNEPAEEKPDKKVIPG